MFGKRAVKDLTEGLGTAFCTALGAAACLFETIAFATEGGVDEDLLYANQCYLEGSYGHGLLHTALSCFPELLGDDIDPAADHLGHSFNDSLMAYESAISRISTACGCIRHGEARSKICLTAMTEFVIYVARIKASLLVDDALEPTFNGLLDTYQRIFECGQRPPKDKLFSLLPDSVFLAAITIYSDQAPSTLQSGAEEPVSAIVNRGLCFYIDSLVSSGSPEAAQALSRVHIVPGTIELDACMYFEIRDVLFEEPKYSALGTEKVTSVTAAVQLMNSFKFMSQYKVEAIVNETENYLTFGYKVSSPLGTTIIPPLALTKAATGTRNFIYCKSVTGATQCPTQKAVPAFTVARGEGVPTETLPGTSVRVVPSTSPAWCIALLSTIEHWK